MEGATVMTEYNKSLAGIEMPARIKKLPISSRGFPVPWFVAWMKDGQECAPGDGEPDFRVIGGGKIVDAVKHHRCWVCGEMVGIYKAFLIGPMCAINKIISEPCQHRDCSIFSAMACPFLNQPRAKRNEKGLPGDDIANGPAGFGIKRNPGAVCVWITKSFRVFQPRMGNPGVLFSLGHPVEVKWFANGRAATRAEVMASIDSGYPLLQELARQDGPDAMEALETQRKIAVETLVPA
jgi:hypothetical protein